ncbi:MAG: hypothetical protein M3Q33_09470 [Acidobacteriota bacterium]|nr:hypothetical protein [Acidobacteriota bacterium]
MAFAILGIFAGAVSAKEINGYYEGDDGGAYFIRQIGTKVYWFGEDPKGGYANVLVGTINGNKINARFWDVPKGKAKGAGEIVFEIQADGATLSKVSSSVPFGMKTLKKAVFSTSIENGIPVVKGIPTEARSRPAGFGGEENNLTGAWSADDLSTYYVREMPNGDVVWLAENNGWGGQDGAAKPAYAHVFIGKKIGGLITGDWVDVPKGKASASGVLSLKIKNPQQMSVNNGMQGISTNELWRSLPNSLRGFADLHTHPMVHLALGRKFIHGVPDVGSLIPADSDCKSDVRAKSIAHALGKDNSTHGGVNLLAFGQDNPCGDLIRHALLNTFQEMKHAAITPDNAVGYPSFKDYPKYNDLTHQKMWVDWMRRAYDGGQRVMVALAMNNQTLASAVAGPGDAPVTDKESGDLQIKETIAFVKRHNDFMEVAYSSADVRRIVAANKMAVILGVELDNIGNFINYKHDSNNAAKLYEDNFDQKAWNAEVDRLYTMGVRYIFPVHLVDNLFGSTAVYEDLFNLSNYHINHRFWDIGCGKKEDGINYQFVIKGKDNLFTYEYALGGAKAVKLGIDIARFPKEPPVCKGLGHVNARAANMTATDDFVKMLMRRGMLIDIDHSSLITINTIFKLAESVPGGYPLVSGHTGLRADQKTENSRSPEQLARIYKLGGMFGLGVSDTTANLWVGQYTTASGYMGADSEGRIAIGSDLNGLVKGTEPPVKGDMFNPLKTGQQLKACSEIIYNSGFTKSKTGDMTWNYCSDGVAHYGLLADFMKHIRTLPDGNSVNSSLLKNSEAFATMWEKAEKASSKVK